MSSLRLPAQIYLACLATVAAIITAWWTATGAPPTPREWALAGLFIVLLAAALRTPLPFGPHAHLLLDSAVVLSAVLLLPPGLAMLVAGGGPLLSNIPRRVGWEESGFGAAQTALQAAAGLATLSLSGWWDRDDPFRDPTFLIAVLSAGIALHVTNTLAVAGMFALEGGEHPWAAWRRILIPDPTEASGYLAQWGLALLAAVVADAHAWALILLVLPGAVVLGALDRHVRLRLAAEKQLIDQAHHDPLTGLLNRARFTECLEQALSDTTMNKALLFLDLDRFKLVNDTLGHEAGDHLLKSVADRIRACVEPGDLVARLGGDEFVVLLDNEGNRSIQVAEDITVEMAAPVWLKGHEMVVTSSIGIARASESARSADDLLRNADIALYQAKRTGRNRATVYDDVLGAATRERAALHQALQDALNRDGLWLAYQPQIELDSGAVVALEALIRWESDERGALSPPDFLAIAEETGLILPLGRWVLQEACHAAQRWAKQLPRPPAVAVNIGAMQLADPQLIADVSTALATSGLQPSRLRLEIAEEAAMGDPNLTLKVLKQLEAIGVHLILDDFGSGRSSLPHLAHFPVETLALDRALVSQVGRTVRAEAVVRAVTSAANELGFKVAAKGIERDTQELRLRALGCSFGQGHFYGQPAPEEAAIDRLKRGLPAIAELAEAS